MYLPLVLTAIGWLKDPAALAAFLRSLADNAEPVAAAFERVRAQDVLSRALQGQAGPELRVMGQQLLQSLAGPLMAAAMAAQAAAGRR